MKTLNDRRYSLKDLEAGQLVLEGLAVDLDCALTDLDETFTFFDSFDRRLQKSGLALLHKDGAGEVVLHAVDGHRICHARPVTPIGWGKDLPPGPLRERLLPLLGCRRLLQVATVTRTGHGCRILDQRKKTTARIDVEQLAVMRPNGQLEQLGARLVLSPVRGYEKTEKRLHRKLKRTCSLTSQKRSEIEEVLSAIENGALTKKVTLKNPKERSDVATQQLLGALLETVKRNEEGVLKNIDTEFLHDLRVAVRTSRSLLSQMTGVFPVRQRKSLKTGLRWLQQQTSAMRDLDVYRLKLPEYRAQLKPEFADALSPLESLLENEAILAHRQLCRQLGSPRYRKLLESWQQLVDRPPSDHRSLPNARRPIALVASRRIYKVYRRILSRGAKISSTSPASEIHALRLDAKKLRYLLEAFQGVFPKVVKKEIRALKRLQDVLGDFNDCEVQHLALRNFAEELSGPDSAAGACQRAIGQLLDRLTVGQEKARNRLGARFSRFSKRKHRRLYRRLFKLRRPSL